MDALNAGVRVVDVSGIRVGHVVSVKDGRFEVERDHAGGGCIWLRQDAVFNVSDGMVTLVCNESDIERYGSDPPL